MNQNLEDVRNELKKVRAKVRSSNGTQSKLRLLEQALATAGAALSQIDEKHARTALRQAHRAGETNRKALYGLLPGYFDSSDRLEQRILGISEGNVNEDGASSQDFNTTSVSQIQNTSASNDTIRNYGDRDIVPKSYEKYLNWHELVYIPSTYGIKEHKLECLNIPSDIEWWKNNGKVYYDNKTKRKAQETYHHHIITRHGEQIASSAALNSLDDIPIYLRALANSQDSERCVQYLQNKNDVIKFDKVTRVCLVLTRTSNGNAKPITAFKIDHGARHKYGKDPYYDEDLYMPHFEYKFFFKQWR